MKDKGKERREEMRIQQSRRERREKSLQSQRKRREKQMSVR